MTDSTEGSRARTLVRGCQERGRGEASRNHWKAHSSQFNTTLDNILVLGLIVLIRTFLSFSLESRTRACNRGAGQASPGTREPQGLLAAPLGACRLWRRPPNRGAHVVTSAGCLGMTGQAACVAVGGTRGRAAAA
jgi:hypothetical protein